MTPPGTRLDEPRIDYVPPALQELGTLHELTLGCIKSHGGSDGFTFHADHIVCTSP